MNKSSGLGISCLDTYTYNLKILFNNHSQWVFTVINLLNILNVMPVSFEVTHYAYTAYNNLSFRSKFYYKYMSKNFSDKINYLGLGLKQKCISW